jgi:hypothetical protein
MEQAESMATPGELCAKTSEVLGLELNTTLIAWRALREGAHVTTGGRGRSAAHCVPADAANLLIAAIGKMPLQSYLKSWERYSNLKEKLLTKRSISGKTKTELDRLEISHSFKDGLTALITSAKTGSLQAFLENAPSPGCDPEYGRISVHLNGPFPQAGIEMSKRIDPGSKDLQLWYSDKIVRWPDQVRRIHKKSGDLSRSMTISERTILTLGEFLRQDR